MRGTRGFTLVEALVALVVLSVGLLGSSMLLLGGLREHSHAQRLSTATRLVADVAERVRATGASSADLADFGAAARAALPHHQTQASITFAPATGPADTASWRIALRWQDSGETDDTPEVSLIVFARSPVAG